ncbi:hypothetical protein BD780_003856 [Clostridium tetanomorphum]|nr:hypothetical protein [Clostridium tetanomorphum]NRS86567.1 hypothetical protein [Clostridium tetanomorphum]NRS86631.1 hypothetical protein [Clostridium tetanomorphum]NRZ95406.1 hypothetical protein [Clostridium tetanomorphum]SQC00994.1 Uncharacterised protein [Clostridium tetanomorphum]
MKSNLKDKLLKETEKLSSSELLMVLEAALIELTKEGVND